MTRRVASHLLLSGALLPGNRRFRFLLIGIVGAVPLSGLVSYICLGRVFTYDAVPLYLHYGWLLAAQLIAFLYLNHYVIRHFDDAYAGRPLYWGRYALEVCLILVAGMLLTEAVDLLPLGAQRYVPPGQQPGDWADAVQNLNLCVLLLTYGVFSSYRIFRLLQVRQEEVLRWQREVIQSQFEALKDQLNPHFLFNSLSVLTSLVYADPDAAEAFIDKLSRTYRYLLDHREKRFVDLGSELGFLDHFRFLLAQRFGSKLQIKNRVAPFTGPLLMPPHTLMILLEHIIAGSRMSVAEPLTIELYLEGKTLVIRHDFRPRPVLTGSASSRLYALRERYRVLGGPAPLSLLQKGDTQIISVPLFDPAHAPA